MLLRLRLSVPIWAGAPLAVLNEAGNRWGSWVASQDGAMPPLSADTFEMIEVQILQAAGQ